MPAIKSRTYLLREIPDDLWRRVKAQAAHEGRAKGVPPVTLRHILLRALAAYCEPPGFPDPPEGAR